MRRQCELLGLNRSTVYYRPAAETPENLRLMELVDRQFTARPFYGSRRMTAWLRSRGHEVNRERVQRLLGVMGLEAIHPRPRRRGDGQPRRVFPYLLRDVAVERADQVWSADITSLPLAGGFMDLAATIDWFSRFVVAWKLSHTLDGAFCRAMLDEALSRRTPEVFNTDQGAQFTAQAWTDRLETAGIRVSMDGRGRAADNVFVERLGRTVKYEDVYLRGYETVPDLAKGRAAYFAFYNHERLHQSLGYRTPADVYGGPKRAAGE